MSIRSFKDLKVWQRAMDLIEECYKLTRQYPAEERIGLISQIRRSAVSVAANVAEGQGRSSTKEFLNHLSIARGSLKELETLLIVSSRVGYLAESELERLAGICDEVSRMLSGLRQSFQSHL